MIRGLICSVLLIALFWLPMAATTFTVSNTNNSGAGSLRQAITDANGTSGATAGSPHIIDATGISGTISLQSALPSIANHITINGPGAANLTVSRSVATKFRIITNDAGYTLTLDGITLSNGYTDADYGGGIYNTGTLTLTNTILSNDSSDYFGGGIYNVGTLTITNSELSNNWTGFFGGGIANEGGDVTVTGSTFSENNAENFYGGGIYSYGTLIVTNSKFVDNLAYGGGAIHSERILTLTGSTISGNNASFGGGIYNSNTVTIINSTIANNVGGAGGGIMSVYGRVTMVNSTLSGNYASGNGAINNTTGGGGILNYEGTITPFNTIIAGNTSGGGGPDIRGNVSSAGHNIIGNTSGNAGWVSSDQQNVNPQLNSLASNGGPTQTMALSSNSPAIDAGNDDVLDDPYYLTNDQRGQGHSRSVGSHVDIGAYELAVEVTNVSLSGISPYCLGSDVTISWLSSEVTSVDIDFSTNNGVTWSSIATGISNGTTGGSYDWTIPNSVGSNRRVRVSNAANSSISGMSNAFVIDGPPTVTSHPISNDPACPGASVTFTAAASGTPSVQWQLSADFGASFDDIDGETSSSLTISSTTLAMDGYQYRAVFTNACSDSDTTDAATLRVHEDESAPIPDVAILSNVTGECSVTVNTAPTATDNCAGSITGTTTDPLFYNVQGTHTIHWTYDDGNGNTSTQNQSVIVDDVTAPVPNVATLSQVMGECSATVTSTPTASDNCAETVVATTIDPLEYTSQGTYTIHWTYNDGNGNTTTQLQTVVVDDATAPTLSVTVSPVTLWPPNEAMRTIAISASTGDNCGSATWVLNSISGNDGATSSDWSYTANSSPSSVLLRAKRTGSGNGRTYTLNFTANDGHDNTTNAVCYVYVPHSQNKVVTGRSIQEVELGFMSQVAPNPFTTSTDIGFALQSDGMVTIRIYNLLGHEVAVVLRDQLKAGSHRVTWQGLTADGTRATAGEYFYRIESGGVSETGQIVIAR